MSDEDLSDEFLAKFKRGPDDPRPEWAFRGDNILREMDEVPLFMTDVPDNVQDIPALAALQALIYDGSPEEVAKNFKDQGNEAYKTGQKGYQDAIKYYTQGLEQKCSDNILNALLHLNRAAVHISSKNYGKALDDCLKAVELDGSNPNVLAKGYLRAAKACFGLGRFDESHKYVLSIPAIGNDKMKEETALLCKTITEAIEQEERRKKELERRSKLDKKTDIMLKSRGIKRVPDCERHLLALLGPAGTVDLSRLPSVGLVPKSANQLQWPVLIFYPPYGQSDTIEALHEHTLFADLVGMVTSEQPEWDTDGLYKPSCAMTLYYHSVDHQNGQEGELYSIDLKYRLADLFGTLIKQVDRGIQAFFLLPSGKDAETQFLSRFSSGPIKYGS
jgi:tetratricopeptide (TPR) repeat protein